MLAVRPGATDLDIGIAGPYPPGGPAAFEVRAFVPKNGATDEDPVTGSLNASLAQWLLATGRAQAPYLARQGTALGRNGEVQITVDADGTVWVGGGAVTCVRGTVELVARATEYQAAGHCGTIRPNPVARVRRPGKHAAWA